MISHSISSPKNWVIIASNLLNEKWMNRAQITEKSKHSKWLSAVKFAFCAAGQRIHTEIKSIRVSFRCILFLGHLQVVVVVVDFDIFAPKSHFLFPIAGELFPVQLYYALSLCRCFVPYFAANPIRWRTHSKFPLDLLSGSLGMLGTQQQHQHKYIAIHSFAAYRTMCVFPLLANVRNLYEQFSRGPGFIGRAAATNCVVAILFVMYAS